MGVSTLKPEEGDKAAAAAIVPSAQVHLRNFDPVVAQLATDLLTGELVLHPLQRCQLSR